MITSPSNPERLHALDAARGLALILVVVLHASMSFLPVPLSFGLAILDSQKSLTLALLFYVLLIFVMPTFFLIAGFFAHASLQRKGRRGFILDRLKRIGIPLVLGWPILFGAILSVSIWGIRAHGGPVPPRPVYPGFPAFPLAHLWFLYVLLLLYAGALGMLRLAHLADPSARLGQAVDRVARWLVRSPFGLIALSAPTAATLWLLPEWVMWFGIPTPAFSLIPNAGAAVAFSIAFGFGWLVHRQVALIEIWTQRWPLNLALAIGLTAASLLIVGGVPVVTPAPHDWVTALYAACYTLATWAWTFALIGLALRFFSRFSAARRYVADASYWIYLIHLPVVMALQVAVSQLDWPWFVKFPLILAVALPLTLLSYQFFVRYSFIGAALNGRRQPRQNLPAVGAAVAGRAGN